MDKEFLKLQFMRHLNYQRGLTLIEMLVALGILGILTAVALPSFMDTLGRSGSTGAVKTMINSLSFARGEAITRGRNVSICPSSTFTDCAANSWATGWIVFVDNNDDATGSSGSVDNGDEVIQVYTPATDIVISSASSLLQYDSRGFGLNSASITLKFCPIDNNANNARSIEVGISGRARSIEGGLTCP